MKISTGSFLTLDNLKTPKKGRGPKVAKAILKRRREKLSFRYENPL